MNSFQCLVRDKYLITSETNEFQRVKKPNRSMINYYFFFVYTSRADAIKRCLGDESLIVKTVLNINSYKWAPNYHFLEVELTEHCPLSSEYKFSSQEGGFASNTPIITHG